MCDEVHFKLSTPCSSTLGIQVQLGHICLGQITWSVPRMESVTAMQLPGGTLCVPVPSETPLPHKAFNCDLVTDLVKNRKKQNTTMCYSNAQLLHVKIKGKFVKLLSSCNLQS